MEKVLERMSSLRVVPVIAIEDASVALDMADALIAGGLPIAEITFRTAAAAEAIKIISENRPEMIVGAGTVLTPETLEVAIAAGARFAVAPGSNMNVIKAAQEMNFPFIPGVATPTEIESAIEAGCKVLKYFPAEAVGGVKLLSAMYAPYKHLGIKFMPTGGVNTGNLETYLNEKAVIACGGTWLVKPADLAAKNWDNMTALCAEAKAIASKC